MCPQLFAVDQKLGLASAVSVIPSRRRGTCFLSRNVQVSPGGISSLLCFARCRERVTFLCLCKEKVTKRKHTPSVAPGAERRVHGLRRVFRQHIRVLVEKRAASCRAPCGPDPQSPSQPGAPADQGQNQCRLVDSLMSADSQDSLRKMRGYLRPRHTGFSHDEMREVRRGAPHQLTRHNTSCTSSRCRRDTDRCDRAWLRA